MFSGRAARLAAPLGRRMAQAEVLAFCRVSSAVLPAKSSSICALPKAPFAFAFVFHTSGAARDLRRKKQCTVWPCSATQEYTFMKHPRPSQLHYILRCGNTSLCCAARSCARSSRFSVASSSKRFWLAWVSGAVTPLAKHQRNIGSCQYKLSLPSNLTNPNFDRVGVR